MKVLYEKTLGGVCIQRCYTLDSIAELPEKIEDNEVTELERYAFSETVRGRKEPPAEMEGEPQLSGNRLEELSLPKSMKKIGAYAFYNCTSLRRLSCFSAISDWGAGVFTGCSGMKELDICIVPGLKSCFKEIISELRQTLCVNYRDESGNLKTKLIFPEFFEESVENTPARIIMREMHGCGHMYRYCFDGTMFRFDEYDALFPHVRVQEKSKLVTKLALYRLYWNYELRDEAKEAYWNYIKDNGKEAVKGLALREEMDILRWLVNQEAMEETLLEEMAETAGELKNPQASSILMEALHKKNRKMPEKESAKTRTFLL